MLEFNTSFGGFFMRRRNESPEKNRWRALIEEFLKDNPINDFNDINDLVKELISQVLENGLEDEFNDELGNTRYDSLSPL